MTDKEKYLREFDTNLKKYKKGIQEITNVIEKYKSPNINKIIQEGEGLKEKYKKAEDIYKKLKTSSQEKFEDTKQNSSEIFSALSQSITDFASLVSREDLANFTDEITGYGSETIEELQKVIKNNPYHFIVGVFGIGVLIGLFVSRLR